MPKFVPIETYDTRMTYSRPPALFITLALSMTVSSLMAQWQKLAPMPEPSGGSACGADGTGILVIGGTNWANGTKNWLQTISRFDPKKLQWSIVGKLGEPLAYAVYGEQRSDDALVILGGSSGKAPAQSMVIVHKSKSSSQPVAALRRQIVLSAGGIIGDTFIIVGGTDDAANIAGFTNHASAWSLNQKAITTLPDYPGKPFGSAAAAVLADELFVFGGANPIDSGVANTSESYAFSMSTKQWRKLKPYPLAARGPTAVALDEHRIYIAGGYGGEPEGFLSAAFIYDRRTDSYAKATPLPYAASVSLAMLDGFVYCLGGEDKMKSRTDAAWRIPVVSLTQ